MDDIESIQPRKKTEVTNITTEAQTYDVNPRGKLVVALFDPLPEVADGADVLPEVPDAPLEVPEAVEFITLK